MDKTKYLKIYGAIDSLIELNKAQTKKNEIYKICKLVLTNTDTTNAIMMDISEIFKDNALNMSDLPVIMNLLLKFDSYFSNSNIPLKKIKMWQFRYILFSLIHLYFINNSDDENIDQLITFYNSIYNLIEYVPHSYKKVSGIFCK